MPFLLSSICIFPQGVNAAFDILLICNVNVYELSQKLLLRKNPLDVSYSIFTLPVYCVINDLVLCMINVTFHTLSVCVNMNYSALCSRNSFQVTSIDLYMSVTRGNIFLTGEWDVTDGIAYATGSHGSWRTLDALCTLEDHGNRTTSIHWSRQPCLFRRKYIS